MPRMTEEEAEALDDFVTNNPPRVDPSKARHAIRMVALIKAFQKFLLPKTFLTSGCLISTAPSGHNSWQQ